MQTVQIHFEILLSGFVLLQPLLEHWIHPGQRMDGLWCDTTGEPTCRCEFVSEYNYWINTALCVPHACTVTIVSYTEAMQRSLMV